MKKLLLLSLLISFSGCEAFKNFNEPNKVILLSFDGFRADYLQKTDTPNFDHFIQQGVTSQGLIPVFPTNTFPNYYAIATGLYPENNGIIDNNMYDPEMDAYYSIGDREAVENPKWYEGEPIWNTVEKEGYQAGTMFWVGSEAPIQDMRPTFWKSYDGSMPDSARIDTVMKWMTLDSEKEIELATLYFSFTDTQGHRHGPDSPEVVAAIRRSDNLLGYLMEQLEKNGLKDQTNVIIVSDHGMSEVSPERVIFLDDFIAPEILDIISNSPAVMADIEGDNDRMYFDQIKKAAESMPFQAYLKEDIPERYHLKNHPRVPELLMIAEPGYTITTKAFAKQREGYPSGGAHGYDNKSEEMYALFAANGPDIYKGVVLNPIENIHIYLMITELLDLNASETDGNLSTVRQIVQ